MFSLTSQMAFRKNNHSEEINGFVSKKENQNHIFPKKLFTPENSNAKERNSCKNNILGSSSDHIFPKKLFTPENSSNAKERNSCKDNILGSSVKRNSRTSQLLDAKLKDHRRSSKRSVIKKNNYLPRHIEGKYSVEEIHFLKEILRKNDTFCAVISCCGLIMAWIENEIFFSNENQSQITNHVLRGIVTCTCMISHYFIFQHYKFELEILKSRKIIYQGISLLRSSLFPKYFVESVFNWIHCPPFLDSDFSNEQFGIKFDLSINAYLSVIMLGRLYIFLRLFDHYTFWTGERAIRVCRINGFLPDSKFAIKAYLKYKSVIVLTFSIGLSIILFGFALRTFERPFYSLNRPKQFDDIMNAFWCVIVSMATIGYGDIYPITLFGRFIIIIACIWGIFILSLFVVSLNNITQLSKEENKAYEDITRENKIKSTLHHDAAKIIITLFKLNLSRKKKLNIKKRILMRMDLMGIANRFRIKRKNVQNENKSVQEILSDMHSDVSRDIVELMETIQPLNNSAPLINDSEKIQGIINEKTLQVHENARRLMNIITKMNKEKIQVESFEQMETNFERENHEMFDNQGFVSGVH